MVIKFINCQMGTSCKNIRTYINPFRVIVEVLGLNPWTNSDQLIEKPVTPMLVSRYWFISESIINENQNTWFYSDYNGKRLWFFKLLLHKMRTQSWENSDLRFAVLSFYTKIMKNNVRFLWSPMICRYLRYCWATRKI